MTARPIILRADEVRAVLAGTKTQVRRPVNMRYVQYLGGSPETSDPVDWGYWVDDEYGRWAVLARGVRERMHNGHVSIPCPLGQPGDRLWVRETWGSADCFYQRHENDEPSVVAYKSDQSAIDWQADPPQSPPAYDIEQWSWDAVKWRSPVTMPRWASRITLEILDVGVEVTAGEWVWAVTLRRLGAEEVKP